MICRYCGKEYSDNSEYCPYCAEPKPKPEKTLDEQYLDKVVGTTRFWSVVVGVFLQVLSILVMGPILGLLFGIATIPASIWAAIYGIRKRVLEELEKNSREIIIKKQFAVDKTSICPSCGSHNVKIYRKGYDYKAGFWGSVFGVKGSGYAAGIDANEACCRCMNCGSNWETGYDYRTID